MIRTNIDAFRQIGDRRIPLKTKVAFPVAQLVEHGVSNAKIMGSIPRESKS